MINYKRWDILLVHFPFTDLSKTKRRPALVVSPDKSNTGKDLIICFITSHITSQKRIGDYLIKEWESSNLPKPSMIRIKLATIDQSIIIKKIGKLSKSDIQEFHKILIEFFS
jgi:mRNA interferase MazF